MMLKIFRLLLFESDFIIMELETPFKLIYGLVQPACLPSKPHPRKADRSVCFTTGWGLTSGGGQVGIPTKVLKGTSLFVTNLFSGNRRNQFYRFNTLRDRQYMTSDVRGEWRSAKSDLVKDHY